jgi:hypothetical protein
MSSLTRYIQSHWQHYVNSELECKHTSRRLGNDALRLQPKVGTQTGSVEVQRGCPQTMCQGRHQSAGGAKISKKKGALSAIGNQVNECAPNTSGAHVPHQQCQDLGGLPPTVPQLLCKQPEQTLMTPPFVDPISKRQLMLAVGVSILSAAGLRGPAAQASTEDSEISPPERSHETQRKAEKIQKEIGGPNLLVDYTKAGPYDIRTLPTVLEHTCANCYPQCVDGELQLHEGPRLDRFDPWFGHHSPPFEV